MKLIVGLGNPGRRYERTRHNIGASVVEKIAEENGVLLNKKRFDSKYGAGNFWDEEILLVLPQTYMNRSGDAVRQFIRWKAIGLADTLVVCDDINLPLGALRIRRSGSSGGHKGLGSIIGALGSAEFARLRLGVGRDERREDIADYVLEKFRKEEKGPAEQAINCAASCAQIWVRDGITAAMEKFNKQRGR